MSKFEIDLYFGRIDCLEEICSDYGDNMEFHQNFARVFKRSAVYRVISYFVSYCQTDISWQFQAVTLLIIKTLAVNQFSWSPVELKSMKVFRLIAVHTSSATEKGKSVLKSLVSPLLPIHRFHQFERF